jgi:predicted  nucleic acid-binding Zn-ribbon protein
MSYNDQLNIRVDRELKDAFIQKAKRNRTSATELIISYMEEYLGMRNPGSSLEAEVQAIKARQEKIEELLQKSLGVSEGELVA